MDIKKLIDELYQVVKEYEKEKSDRFTDRLNGLYAQIDILEAVENGSTNDVLKNWHSALKQDSPGKKR